MLKLLNEHMIIYFACVRELLDFSSVSLCIPVYKVD